MAVGLQEEGSRGADAMHPQTRACAEQTGALAQPCATPCVRCVPHCQV
jgi:hypothetical protein